MIRHLIYWIGLGLLAAAGSGCLVSNLHNGFDLKTPAGFLGYLGGLTRTEPSGSKTCMFDASRFDSCELGP